MRFRVLSGNLPFFIGYLVLILLLCCLSVRFLGFAFPVNFNKGEADRGSLRLAGDLGSFLSFCVIIAVLLRVVIRN